MQCERQMQRKRRVSMRWIKPMWVIMRNQQKRKPQMKTQIPSSTFNNLKIRTEYMKLLISVAPYVRAALLIAIASGMWALTYSINIIRKEITNIYVLHMYQARQIDVLLNLQLRESREKEQEWLRETRDRYEKLDSQNEDEKILEKSSE